MSSGSSTLCIASYFSYFSILRFLSSLSSFLASLFFSASVFLAFNAACCAAFYLAIRAAAFSFSFCFSLST
jgi:hypothetical protein